VDSFFIVDIKKRRLGTPPAGAWIDHSLVKRRYGIAMEIGTGSSMGPFKSRIQSGTKIEPCPRGSINDNPLINKYQNP
jgi:hypothetical protein